MQTPAERARKDAFRQWFLSWKAGTSHSDADVRKWEEAFVAGWNARAKFFVEDTRTPR